MVLGTTCSKGAGISLAIFYLGCWETMQWLPQLPKKCHIFDITCIFLISEYFTHTYHAFWANPSPIYLLTYLVHWVHLVLSLCWWVRRSVTGAWRTYQDSLFSNPTNYIPESFVSTHSHTIGSERSQTKERHHSRSCSNSKLSRSLSKGQVKKKLGWDKTNASKGCLHPGATRIFFIPVTFYCRLLLWVI